MTSREVLRVAPGATLSRGALMATAFAADNRWLLPPFPPLFRNEDGVVAAVLQRCWPRTLLGHPACALAHWPVEAREHAAERHIEVASETRVSDLLIALVAAHRPPAEPADAAERLRAMGRFLREAASDADRFRDATGVALRSMARARLAHLEHTLQRAADAPAFWRRDVELHADRLRRASSSDSCHVPVDVPGARSAADARELVRRYVRRVGELFCCWPEVWATAQRLGAHAREAPTFELPAEAR
jgi:hypothetical protein